MMDSRFSRLYPPVHGCLGWYPAGWVDIEITGRLPDAVERHLRHTRILKPGKSPEAVIALLARSRDEWLAVASEARRKGLSWAGLLDRNLVGQGASHDRD